MNQVKFFLFGVVSIVFFACQSDKNQGMAELDLTRYGAPVSILAPDSAKVTTQDYGISKDISVQAGPDYYVMVLASEANTMEVSKVKADQLQNVKEGTFFSQIVEEHDQGFIYENKLDSMNIFYGFRYIKIQGDKEFVFQEGLSGGFDLEAVQRMYQAVQQ
ncbi:MAG: hypothetical protein KDC44_22360 [Phaeodactylibacter sp.]|nr:hypothetical protein [Phaeodactylibacter sp.]